MTSTAVGQRLFAAEELQKTINQLIRAKLILSNDGKQDQAGYSSQRYDKYFDAEEGFIRKSKRRIQYLRQLGPGWIRSKLQRLLSELADEALKTQESLLTESWYDGSPICRVGHFLSSRVQKLRQNSQKGHVKVSRSLEKFSWRYGVGEIFLDDNVHQNKNGMTVNGSAKDENHPLHITWCLPGYFPCSCRHSRYKTKANPVLLGTQAWIKGSLIAKEVHFSNAYSTTKAVEKSEYLPVYPGKLRSEMGVLRKRPRKWSIILPDWTRLLFSSFGAALRKEGGLIDPQLELTADDGLLILQITRCSQTYLDTPVNLWQNRIADDKKCVGLVLFGLRLLEKEQLEVLLEVKYSDPGESLTVLYVRLTLDVSWKPSKGSTGDLPTLDNIALNGSYRIEHMLSRNIVYQLDNSSNWTGASLLQVSTCRLGSSSSFLSVCTLEGRSQQICLSHSFSLGDITKHSTGDIALSVDRSSLTHLFSLVASSGVGVVGMKEENSGKDVKDLTLCFFKHNLELDTKEAPRTQDLLECPYSLRLPNFVEETGKCYVRWLDNVSQSSFPSLLVCSNLYVCLCLPFAHPASFRHYPLYYVCGNILTMKQLIWRSPELNLDCVNLKVVSLTLNEGSVHLKCSKDENPGLGEMVSISLTYAEILSFIFERTEGCLVY